MILSVKNLTKIYEDKTVVDNVEFELEKGKMLCILGPSGCGKSTILNMIGGFVKPNSGQIILDGEDITNLTAEKRDITTVFQSYGLFYHMNVFKNIAYGLKFKNIDKTTIENQVNEMIELVGLKGHEKKMIDELSGGQRQRVAMGRAIVRNPKVFLMDEPLSNLDAKLRVQMRIEISKLHQKLGTTMIYVTHDQTEAMTLGTRIVVMKDGVVQQIDTPQNLYDHPKNLFVASFIGSPQINLIDVEVLKENEEVYVKNDHIKLKLPKEKADFLVEKNYIGKKLIFGIRPESIYDEEEFLEKADKEAIIDAKIRVYELMGAEVYLYFDLGEDQITARVSPSTKAKVGETTKFAFDMEKSYLFDPETKLIIE